MERTENPALRQFVDELLIKKGITRAELESLYDLTPDYTAESLIKAEENLKNQENNQER